MTIYLRQTFTLFFYVVVICTVSCHQSNKVRLANKENHRSAIQDYQEQLNQSFANKNKSPLDSIDRANFSALDFFPIDPSYQVLADLIRMPNEKPFAMPTSTDQSPIYIKFGEAKFQLKNETFTLSLYRNIRLARTAKHRYHLFVPFTDLTNGNSSYGGGRYIDLTIPKGDKIIIDFNKAYNPYCCYSDRFSCPVPPRENFLDTEIQAGVMAWEH